MKIGPLTRKLTTVYLLLALFGYLTVGCLRQPADVISQSNQKSDNPLITASNSSSFNFFDQKKKVSVQEKPGRVKLGTPTSVPEEQIAQAEHKSEAMQPGPVKISQAAFEDAERQRQEAEAAAQNKPVKRSPADLDDWRSKSLIASARKYPSKLMDACQQNSERIQQASGSISREFSQGIRRLAGTSQPESTSQEKAVTPQEPLREEPNFEQTADDVFRSDELGRYLDQADQQQSADPQLKQLGQELERDLQQTNPVFEDVSQEMRRLQISSIMERARRELKQKNYEYAQFLAEQALETSYRGHVAFGLDEVSPQMLLQQIKEELAAQQPSDLKQTGHSEPQVQSNGGQRVPNFRPSRVHPLKRRATPPQQPEPVKMRPVQPASPGSASDELPLIVPRNMGTTPVQPQQPIRQKSSAGSLSLEPPSFEPTLEAPVELPPIEQPIQQREQPVPQEPSVKLELEEVPAEAPARIELKGPEPAAAPVQPSQTVEKQDEKPAAGPGPQLMLPKLPSVPGDQTSQTGRHRSTQTAPVKFRSRIQDRGAEPSPFVEQKLEEVQAEAGQAGTSLQLDEIEWDLAEKKRPEVKSGWGSLTTLLLVAGGVIIFLLSGIIIVLLRRGTSAS